MPWRPLVRSSPDNDPPLTRVVEHKATHTEEDLGSPASGPSAQDPIGMRRWRPVHLVSIAIALLGVSLLSLWAGTRIKSPAQAAADAAPPIPSVITAPVVARQLAEQLVLRGTIELDGVDIIATASDGLSVVTDVRVTERDQVASGDVPIVVSGRPVVALTGQLPAYRDLVPGSVGPDIAQLQAALDGLGYTTSEPDPPGSFGGATQELVSQLYADLGFEPALTSPDAFLVVANAKRAVEAAADNLALAIRQQSAAQTNQDRAMADIAVAQAERAVEAAKEEASLAERRHGVMLPLEEFVFVPEGEALVLEANAVVGQLAPEGVVLMTLGTGGPRVRIELSESQRSVIAIGTAVEVRDPFGETNLEGRVEGIAQEASADPSVPPIYVAWVTTAELLPDTLIGLSIQVVVAMSTTDGEVLTVPVTAVSGHADGTTTVSVLRDDTQSQVDVEVGLSAGGFVEVEPVEPGVLEEGYQVVLGARAGG